MWPFWLLVLLLFLDNADILHVAATEDYIFVLVRRGWDELGALPPIFRTKREDMFEGDGRLFRIDVMKDTDIAAQRQSVRERPTRRQALYRISLFEIKLNFWLF